MAGTRDLVEASTFDRRRLVTAFVRGAPGGREVEPDRPGRTLAGGLALAVLLVAGVAAVEALVPSDPVEWDGPGLVVSADTGVAYVVLEPGSRPVLRPVANLTSARLLLGDVEPTVVPQSAIDRRVVGAEVGIPGAPSAPPAPARLVQSGWTACTADRAGLRLRVAAPPGAVRRPRSGLLVRSRGAHHLIAHASPVDGAAAGAYRYALPEAPDGSPGDGQDNLLGDLGLPIRRSAARVPGAWLALFPPGGALALPSFALRGLGDPVPYRGRVGVPADSRIGDVVTFPAYDGARGSVLLTGRGPAVLDPFALTVYRAVTGPLGRPGTRPGRRPPVETMQDEPPAVPQARAPYRAAHWPGRLLRRHPGELCAELETAPGEAPTVHLATAPDAEATARDLPAGTSVAAVASARGAYVRSGAWARASPRPVLLIDARATRHPLVGAEAAERLGYGDVAVVEVPDSWVAPFHPGVGLSVEAARCPPQATGSCPAASP